MKTNTTFSTLILFLVGSFVLLNIVAVGEPTQKTILKIQGMVCEACPPKIKKALEELDGVKKAEVSLEKAEAYVESEPGKVTTEQMIQAVDQAGFKASPTTESFSEIVLYFNETGLYPAPRSGRSASALNGPGGGFLCNLRDPSETY